MVGIGAPSIRLNAFRLPPSSRIATFSVTPISLAFATAAFTIFCASSEEMLCFFTTSAIGHLPLFQSALAPFVLFNDNRLNLMVSQDFRFLRKEEFHSLGISELLL